MPISMTLNNDFFAKPFVNINRRLEILNRSLLFVVVVVVRENSWLTTTPSRFNFKIDGTLNSSQQFTPVFLSVK